MAMMSLTAYLNNPTISNRLNDVLGVTAANALKTAMLHVYNNNKLLQDCDPKSIAGAAMLAETSHLSLTPSLGQAYIVPYKGKAQFMVGWKGLVQLAHRTGRYVKLHAGKVCDGEISRFNPVTGEPELGEKVSDEVVGYVAYMRLINGFEKTLYMSRTELEQHAEKYSQSYAYDKRSGKKTSPWTTNFDAMATKTVLKQLLSKWGVLSTEMAQVILGDQSVVDRNTFTYTDNKGDVQTRDAIYAELVDADDIPFDETTGEVVEQPLTLEAQS